MKILVTGGTGFIGKFLIQKINKSSNQILILSRNADKFKNTRILKYLRGDLSNLKKVKSKILKFNPDITVHLAWEGIPDYSADNSYRNLLYGIELIKLISETDCKKIIAAGSLWEYGQNKGRITENTPVTPFNAFTTSKNALNFFGGQFCKEKGMTFIWPRLFFVYGPFQKKESLIPYLINSIMQHLKPEIRNPNALNDFIYVEDVADAIYQLVVKKVSSGEYNIGSGKLVSIKYITDKIYKSFDVKKNVTKTKRNPLDQINSLYADLTKIKKATGWKPKTTIDEGIKKTIESIRK